MKNSRKKKTDAMWIVFMTTYPPRECGLATFSSDLIDSFDKLFSPQEETKVIAMEVDAETADAQKKNPKVIFHVSENNKEDYVNAAKYVNGLAKVKLVSIQHEFGIFGQNDGENVLIFLEEVKKPVAVTFHTVLPNPSEHILEIVKKIAERAERLIVMTQSSRGLLETVYGAPSEKIKVIHHGIHALPYTESADSKKELTKAKLDKLGNLKDKKVISTFGLLNRGKGIEFAIEALPAIVKEFPETQYLVIGATHPVVLRREGPVYIHELRQKAESLGVLDHVHFYNSFVKTSDLLKFLQASDIYLALSQNPDQAVSGTLTYALGAGRPVISTPFMQAKEVVTNEVGVLAQFNDSASIAHAVIDLFKDPAQLDSKSRAAYFRTRGMVWPNIALSYMNEFVAMSPELAQKEKALPRINLSHIKKMTDKFGMFQFAILTEPNPLSGYTLDDNARSLITMAWEYDRDIHAKNKKGGGDAASHVAKYTIGSSEIGLAGIYLSFLERAAMENAGFVNYYDVEKKENHLLNTAENLEDSNARALWAIAELFGSHMPENLRKRAEILFLNQLSHHKRIASPRAAALFIKAFSVWLSACKKNSQNASDSPEISHLHDSSNTESKAKADLHAELISHITFYADFLMSILKDNETKDWIWFEDAMTYSNAVLPEALFMAHEHTGYEHFKAAGERTLNFLLANSLENNVCMPIGQAGWFKRGGVKEQFDQQPEEVSALVLALCTAGSITKEEKYFKQMKCIFSWFLGNNVLNQVIYSHATGGCYDGLGDQHINLNQGAESTVTYLLARLAMEKEA